ncbi:hypothetical protein CNMCM5623_007534 [Aspergillus felis]|uniref:Ankyrin repeat protein n=1 Tax=Aspergillus felis TaxID=1287682 RepID=A0A8H6PJS5_9EURO|nr:hypothetical protein CNMCM5623_007534 [Aspergillus felis]
MVSPSRMHASKLYHLPIEVIQLIIDRLWPDETVALLSAVPKLAYLVTDEHLRYQDRWGYTILHRAVHKNAEAIVKLIARRCAQHKMANYQGCTPLQLAISGGRIRITRMLVNAGFDLSAKDLGGRTPLHWACSESSRDSNIAEMVEHMLAKGAEPSVVGKFKETLLHVILEDNLKPNLTVVQKVIDAGVDVDALDIDGFSPLWWCVTNGHESAFELLLAHGADPHIRSYQGTILHEAVAYERETLLKRAVELGVDLSVRDSEADETALMLATRRGFDNFAQILRDAGAET